MSARDRVQRLAAPLLVAVAAAALPGVAAQAQTSPSAHTSAIRYDAMNRVTGAIAPDPDGAGPLKFAATRTTYNSVGLPTKVETGELAGWHSEAVAPASWPTAATSPSTGFTVLSSVETSYDIAYRKAKVVTKGSDGITTGVVQYSYDTAGRLECTAVRMNPATYASLPASACTLGTEGSFGPDRITRNVYDAAGQLLKVQKAYGTPLAEDYVTYTYTTNSKQATVTDAKGHVATYAYDGFDRLAAWRFPSKANGTVSAPCTIGTIAETAGVTGPSQARTAGDDCEKYGYDRNGSRAFLVKRDGSVLTYQYDALNRMTAKIVPDRPDLGANHVRDVYYSYDLRGLQTAARYDSPTGDGLTFTYDGFGRQTGSTIALYGSSYSLANVYDRHGNRTRLTHPDGTHVDYAYDGLDRATTITQGTTTIAGLAYNNRGARVALSQGVTTSYGYDNVGRPTALGHDLSGSPSDVTYGYAYTPASQLASQSRDNDAYAWTGHFDIDRNYAVNGLNQYTSAGSANFCHDDNGNLTADGATVYQYDVENRLVQVRTQVNSDCAALSLAGTQLATLRYDPLGRLHMWSGSLTPARKFVYDGDALVAEYGGTGALTVMARYVHGPGVDEPLAWYDGASVATTALRRLRADHQGSVVVIADNTGAMVALNSYDEYGIPAAGNQGRFQYTGQAWIPDIGMYYYKARIYSPTLGRFLQTDPIGYKDQVNLYAYVGGDPVNYLDSKGTDCGSLIKGAVGGNCSGGSILEGMDGSWSNYLKDTGKSRTTSQTSSQNPLSNTQSADKEITVIAAVWRIIKGAGTCLLMSNMCGMSESRLTLYRAVGPTELKHIRDVGNYGSSPSQAGKYFSYSLAGAKQFRNEIPRSSTITKITVPESTFRMGYNFNDPRGGEASLYFGEPELPILYSTMSRIQILDQ